METSQYLSRKTFIQMSILALGAAWAGTFLQSKLFPEENAFQEAEPVTFPLAELPVGGAKNVTYAGKPAIVLRTPEGLRAFSLICTHLGCTIHWQAGTKDFYCPCHDGRFDQFGEVTGGPPPLPLESIPVRAEGANVILGEEAA
jgi:Rieske Fe-S protein